MKVAQLLATIPDAAAAGICRRAAEAAERGAADGRGLRQAPDAGRARAGLAGALRLLRPQPGGRRLARPGASRDAPRTARRSPASCSIPTCSRPSRPTCSSSRSLFAAASAPRPGDRHPRDRQGDRRAGARGARLRARGEARRRSTRTHPRRHAPQVRVPAVQPRPLDAAAPHASTGSRASRSSPIAERRPEDAQPPRDRDVQGLVASLQPRGVIHGDPHLGNYTVFSEDGEPAGHQPARLRLHPHLPVRASSAASSISTAASCTTTARASSHAYETWGFRGLSAS